MEVDEDGTQQAVQADDYGIVPDFDVLEEEDKEVSRKSRCGAETQNSAEEVGLELEAQINEMKADLEKMVPNMKAIDRLADVEASMAEAEREAEDTRRDSKAAKDRFNDLKRKRWEMELSRRLTARCELFNKAYGHMSACIDKVYKDLTKSKTFQTGGVAFLSVEDAEVGPIAQLA
jgi:structural maintenance of chromosome 1